MCAWEWASKDNATQAPPKGAHGGERLRFANPPALPCAEGDHDRRARELRERALLIMQGDVGMPYTPATKRALELSFEAHRNQRDKAGLPYVYHPFHLAEQMTGEAEACAALLHDAVEDGHLTFAQLEKAGIPHEAVEAVRALTHDARVPYMDYVLALREQPVARAVKLADLRHNANLARLDHPTAADRRRRMRYLIAAALLDDEKDHYDHSLGHWRKRIPLDEETHHTYYLSVFYRPDGVWERLSLDEELASDSHYDFDACHAEALRMALGGQATLPEALADALAHGGVGSILAVMWEQGIAWQEFHYG